MIPDAVELVFFPFAEDSSLDFVFLAGNINRFIPLI
jgi:hypothetical protein